MVPAVFEQLVADVNNIAPPHNHHLMVVVLDVLHHLLTTASTGVNRLPYLKL
jgi:hypothetical protein